MYINKKTANEREGGGGKKKETFLFFAIKSKNNLNAKRSIQNLNLTLFNHFCHCSAPLNTSVAL